MTAWFARGSGGVAAWASVSSTSVSPAAGTLRLVGKTPTVYGSTGVIDGGGTISTFVETDFTAVYQLLGYVTADYVATWQIVTPVAPAVGVLRVVGEAPTLSITTNNYIWPSGAALRTVGQQPAVTAAVDVVEAPTVGTLRFVGQVPTINVQPHVIRPFDGTLRLVGRTPSLDIAHKVASPSVGTLRMRGLGTTYVDWTATWQMLDVRVTTDWAAIWQIGAGVAGDFTATWTVYGRVSLIGVQTAANRVIAAQTRSLPMKAPWRARSSTRTASLRPSWTSSWRALGSRKRSPPTRMTRGSSASWGSPSASGSSPPTKAGRPRRSSSSSSAATRS